MSDQITLPPVSMADLDSVAALVAAVGWPHRRADIAALIKLGHGRLARAGDGRTLGVGLWWPFCDTAARLGLVMVSPDSQGLGIGRRLMERLLADAAPRSVMLLATPAGRPLYERLGFVEVGAVCQHQGEYSGGRHPDPRIRAAISEDWSAVLCLDAAVFGIPRPAVLEHLLAVGRAFVLVENGRVVGYAIERAFGRGSVVGPVVAATEPDAIALFNAAARPGFVRVDRPSEAPISAGT
jgi:GNAT superfamily N-acetyltransferase